MLSIACSKCHVPASVVIQSNPNGVATDHMRCDNCGHVWIMPLPKGRAGALVEPYARRRPDRRAQPR
jgi:uncharacterized Zn finger protein